MNEVASQPPDRRAPDVRVVVVDDQRLFLEAVRALIRLTAGFEVVGEARSGHEALELVAAVAPDLVLLDVRMAGLDGIETARLLHAEHPALVVVLVSADKLEAIEPIARSCGAAVLCASRISTPGCCAGCGRRTGTAHPGRRIAKVRERLRSFYWRPRR